MNLITSFTERNAEHHKDVEQNGQGETLQQQKKTVTSPFNAERTGTEQHQSTLDGKKTAEQVYVGPTGGMYTMPYMREIDGYLGQPSLLRKDFKIRGIIGNSGQKDRINFVSLAHQINDGRTAGYSDNEIAGGVLKAMPPNLRLRNVLESMECLNLDTLLRFLQAHFEEGNAPDLCSQLTSVAQLSDETAYHFAIRCLEMRQKVIVASKQSYDIIYDPNLVQQLFLRTLERGIATPHVLSEIKSYLKSGSVNDEALVLAVTKAVAVERDREENFSSKSKKVKGATVSAVETGQAENSVMGKLANLLEKFDKSVASMESRLDTLSLKQNQRTTRLLRKACKQNNL